MPKPIPKKPSPEDRKKRQDKWVEKGLEGIIVVPKKPKQKGK